MWLRASVTAALAGLVCVACGSNSTGTACTLIGAVSGVNLTLSDVTPATGTFLVHACVRTTCVDQTVDRRTNDQILVTDDTLAGAGPVQVTLVIRKPTRQLVFRATDQVTLTKSQPNGPKCPPTAWYRSVRATAAGQFIGA